MRMNQFRSRSRAVCFSNTERQQRMLRNSLPLQTTSSSTLSTITKSTAADPPILNLSKDVAYEVKRLFSSLIFRCRPRPIATMTVSHPFAGDIILFSPLLFTQGNNRLFSRERGGQRTVTHFYDVLGLTPQATQSQIKSAYYAKSKLHHPDVSKSSQSHKLFTEVTEAYEVLGNLRKRKMYDNGFKIHRPPSGKQQTYGADDIDYDYTQAYQSRSSNFERGNRQPPPRGRSHIYNFDEYYRQHYNEVRERYQTDKRAHAEFTKDKEERQRNAQAGQSVVLLPMMFLVMAYLLMMANHKDVDRLHYKREDVHDRYQQSQAEDSKR